MAMSKRFILLIDKRCSNRWQKLVAHFYFRAAAYSSDQERRIAKCRS